MKKTKETISIYLPKSIKQDIKLTRKINKNIYHEKIEYNGFKNTDKVRVYQYKYTYVIKSTVYRMKVSNQ